MTAKRNLNKVGTTLSNGRNKCLVNISYSKLKF